MVTLDQAMQEIDPKWEAKFRKDSISTGLTIFNRLVNRLHSENKLELRINWPKFSTKFGGFRGQELTTLTGDTGMGKTTWATNIAYMMSEIGARPLIFSLEMGPESVQKKFFRMHCGMRPSKENVVEHHEKFTTWLIDNKALFYDGQDYLPFHHFKLVTAWGALKQQSKFILLDHLEMVLKPGMDADGISRTVASIRALAYKLNIHILVVVQPAKLKGDSKERMVEMDDMKGSSGIKQFSDNVFSIYFDKKEKTTTMKLHKMREDDYGKYQGDTIGYKLGDMSLTYWEEE